VVQQSCRRCVGNAEVTPEVLKILAVAVPPRSYIHIESTSGVRRFELRLSSVRRSNSCFRL
jgi:hypothetical protein